MGERRAEQGPAALVKRRQGHMIRAICLGGDCDGEYGKDITFPRRYDLRQKHHPYDAPCTPKVPSSDLWLLLETTIL